MLACVAAGCGSSTGEERVAREQSSSVTSGVGSSSQSSSQSSSPSASQSVTEELVDVLVALKMIRAGESLSHAASVGKLWLTGVGASDVVAGALDSTRGRQRHVAVRDIPKGSQVTAADFAP
jgi:hypothetical protein